MRLELRPAYLVLTLVLSAAFGLWYLSTAFLLPQSEVSFHARLMTTSPFVYRLLIPYTLGLVLPLGMLDSAALKLGFAVASAWATFLLLPAYTERLFGLRGQGRAALVLACFAMLVAHYCLTRPFMFYYIYDLPSIPLYMASVLLLTRSRDSLSWGAIAFVLVASLNRETVVIALLHALAWHASTEGAWLARLQRMKPVLLRAALLVGGVILVRMVLTALIQPAGEGQAAFMEGENVRIVANVQRIMSEGLHAQAMLLLGCGALIWLPLGWRDFPGHLRLLVLSSLPAFVLLLVVGNMTELRIYGEFVPALAAGLCLFLRGATSGWRSQG